MYRASYCNVYINQRDAQVLVNSLYFIVKWLYMFRTIISPSLGATFNKLYSAIGTYFILKLNPHFWVTIVIFFWVWRGAESSVPLSAWNLTLYIRKSDFSLKSITFSTTSDVGQ